MKFIILSITSLLYVWFLCPLKFPSFVYLFLFFKYFKWYLLNDQILASLILSWIFAFCFINSSALISFYNSFSNFLLWWMFFSFFFFLVVLGFEFRAYTFARQVDALLLKSCSSPFHSGYFGDRVSLFSQASLDHDPPILNYLL
jgi:hypothetical protein